MTLSNRAESRSFDDWLCYLEHQHHSAIDLGLDRISQVANAMSLTQLSTRVITVAGTNGKGSTCRLIEQLLLSLGYSVGVYSSPHLLDYRERVRLNDTWLSQEQHCVAFAAVEAARGEVSLSFFEFGTLAALWLFEHNAPDFVVLEVGLGGRLDATNVVTPEVAVVTTVALDHTDWLGDDLAQIGREKAGIFRAGGKAVVGDPQIVPSVLERARELDCELLAQGVNVEVMFDELGFWSYQSPSRHYRHLPMPLLPLDNAVAALACLDSLDVSVNNSVLAEAIDNWQLIGRMQCIGDKPKIILDVAHNPQSAQHLASQLATQHVVGRIIAVCAMLVDKDIKTSVEALLPWVHQWYIAGLAGPRGDDGSILAQALSDHGPQLYLSPEVAYGAALASAGPDDLVVVFGSFHTVAAILSVTNNGSIGGSSI
jgi:dihydrofolate synthase/folylpolyglutamate synthase